jgi:hypothetical protein
VIEDRKAPVTPRGWGRVFLTRWPDTHQAELCLGCTTGTAATFDKARADFGLAWEVFLSGRTDADFQAWRDQRDWTAAKYRRFDRGERMLPQGVTLT